MNISDIMDRLGVEERYYTRGPLSVTTPIDGSELAQLAIDDDAVIGEKIALAKEAFLKWRSVPAPRRGDSATANSQNAKPRSKPP